MAAMKLIFDSEVTEDTEVFLISSSPGNNSLSGMTNPFLRINSPGNFPRDLGKVIVPGTGSGVHMASIGL